SCAGLLLPPAIALPRGAALLFLANRSTPAAPLRRDRRFLVHGRPALETTGSGRGLPSALSAVCNPAVAGQAARPC
ncbi:MAG: hypothetical protein J7M26_04975, partial [Armatimonadetes bacterium]|nr:hypothetical protein [Armatimonadota bacterium]